MRRTLSTIALALALASGASPVYAQAVAPIGEPSISQQQASAPAAASNSVAPASAATYNPQTFINQYNLNQPCTPDVSSGPAQAINSWFSSIANVALSFNSRVFQLGTYIFTLVGGIALAWYFIKNSHEWTDLPSMLRSVGVRFMTFGVFYALLTFATGTNGQQPASVTIENFFSNAASYIVGNSTPAGAAIQSGTGTGPTTTAAGAYASEGMCVGWKLFAAPLDALAHVQMNGTSPNLLTNPGDWFKFQAGGFIAFLPGLLLSIGSGLMGLLSFGVLCFQTILVDLSARVLAVMGAFLVAFSASPWTQPLADGWWRLAYTNGILKLAIVLVAGLNSILADNASQSVIQALQNSGTSNGVVALQPMLGMFMLTFLMLALAFTTPKYASSLLSGGPSIGAGDFVAAGALGAGVGVGALAGAAGALKLAAGALQGISKQMGSGKEGGGAGAALANNFAEGFGDSQNSVAASSGTEQEKTGESADADSTAKGEDDASRASGRGQRKGATTEALAMQKKLQQLARQIGAKSSGASAAAAAGESGSSSTSPPNEHEAAETLATVGATASPGLAAAAESAVPSAEAAGASTSLAEAGVANSDSPETSTGAPLPNAEAGAAGEQLALDGAADAASVATSAPGATSGASSGRKAPAKTSSDAAGQKKGRGRSPRISRVEKAEAAAFSAIQDAGNALASAKTTPAVKLAFTGAKNAIRDLQSAIHTGNPDSVKRALRNSSQALMDTMGTMVSDGVPEPAASAITNASSAIAEAMRGSNAPDFMPEPSASTRPQPQAQQSLPGMDSAPQPVASGNGPHAASSEFAEPSPVAADVGASSPGYDPRAVIQQIERSLGSHITQQTAELVGAIERGQSPPQTGGKGPQKSFNDKRRDLFRSLKQHASSMDHSVSATGPHMGHPQ